MHGDLALKSQGLEPVLVVNPQIAAATADEGMFPELSDRPRYAVALRVSAAAVERPIVHAKLPADQSRSRSVAFRAPQRDVRFTCAEVADGLGGVQFDAYVRIGLVQL